jgi:hypothetical protein
MRRRRQGRSDEHGRCEEGCGQFDGIGGQDAVVACVELTRGSFSGAVLVPEAYEFGAG